MEVRGGTELSSGQHAMFLFVNLFLWTVFTRNFIRFIIVIAYDRVKYASRFQDISYHTVAW